MLEVKNLFKAYRQNQVLKGINISFTDGKVYAIAGKNGAGKTTLFNCLTGLETYEGIVNFENFDSQKNIGYLMTNPIMLSKITGLEYLKLLTSARSIKVTDLNDKNIFNLPLNEYAEYYSTGMKKKLALTAILLQLNDLFLLDEPFNGLDLESVILVKTIINRLKEEGKLVIISSHMLTDLIELSDSIHYLQNGKLNQLDKESSYEIIKNDMIAEDFTHSLSAIFNSN